MADRGDHGDPEQSDRPAQGLVAEGEQVRQRAAAPRDDHDLDLGDRRQLAQRSGDPGGRMAVLHGRERPHEPTGPATALEPGEHVVASLAALAGDDADRAREQRVSAVASGVRTAPSAASRRRSRSSWTRRSPSPAIRSSDTEKLNEGDDVELPG